MSRIQSIGLLLLACLFAFVSTASVTAQQPLQAEVLEKQLANRLTEAQPSRETDLDRKLTSAFGLDAPEHIRPFKFVYGTKDVAVTALEMRIDEKTNSLMLTQCSVARWEKNSDKIQVAIRTPAAKLTFDGRVVDFPFNVGNLVSIEFADGTKMTFGK